MLPKFESGTGLHESLVQYDGASAIHSAEVRSEVVARHPFVERRTARPVLQLEQDGGARSR